MKKLLSLIITVVSLNVGLANTQQHWRSIDKQQALTHGEQLSATSSCGYQMLDLMLMRQELNKAPQLSSGAAGLVIDLPFPDGSFQQFIISETNLLPIELAAKYPQIKTWSGQGLTDRTATVKIDITQFGFHAMILSANGSFFIDPYNFTTSDTYIVYEKNNLIGNQRGFNCSLDASSEEVQNSILAIKRDVASHSGNTNGATNRSAGTTLRTYRLALACTGEYSQFFGGTVPAVMSAMTTSMNRVSGVYEREVSITFVFVANNDTLIFLNAATDPYSNNSGGTMLGQNQTTVASRIGSSFYDIGHVFSTGGGGIANLGCVCKGTQKAQGVTGSPTPTGDAFDIDYVAHEMGHQFGGNHTFNGSTGGCAGNINTGTAFEPGSGTTIMAYAGICAPQDIQNNSDAFFHTASFDEIMDYTTLSNGSVCPVSTPTNNNFPIITSIGTNQSIPISTPFKLTGVANDPDGDSLTYCWEEYDLGPSGNPTTTVGNSPFFRSFAPSTSPTRIFPKLISIVTNTTSKGERLANYARSYQFRLTTRDNRNGGGGVTYEDVLLQLDVINTGAPFVVTQPNTNLSWPALSQQNITWDVVGTNQAPINAVNVNILLSTDGGYTYPIVLASNVPNTGTATVTMPNLQSTTARVMVEGAGNVFFDISNTNFVISTPQSLAENLLDNESINLFPNPSNGEIDFSWAGKFRGNVTIQIADMTGRVVASKVINKSGDGFVEHFNLAGIANGVYTVQALTEIGNVTKRIIIQ